MQEITESRIKNKLSGKFSYLYPIYEKLRDELSREIPDVRFILKTIYIVIDSNKGLLGVIFWKNDGLHIAIPSSVNHDRVVDGTDLKYNGCESKVIVKSTEEIDDFVVNLFLEDKK